MHFSPRILVVDDEPVIAATLASILRHYRFEVLSANSSKSAIQIAKKFPPDVILSDVVRPRLNGFDTAVQILGFAPKCRFLFLSAFAANQPQECRKLYEKYGLTFEVLPKPTEVPELLGRVADLTGVELEKTHPTEIAMNSVPTRRVTLRRLQMRKIVIAIGITTGIATGMYPPWVAHRPGIGAVSSPWGHHFLLLPPSVGSWDHGSLGFQIDFATLGMEWALIGATVVLVSFVMGNSFPTAVKAAPSGYNLLRLLHVSHHKSV
jgi:CheY-like chemotaxis protein